MIPRKEVALYIPIIDQFNYEDSSINFEDAIKEFTALSGYLNITFESDIISKLYIEVLSEDHVEIKKYFKEKSPIKIGLRYLKFSSSITAKSIDEILNDKTCKFLPFEYFIEVNTRYLFIYSNLAKPGVLEPRQGFLVTHLELADRTEKIEIIPALWHHMGEAVDTSEKYKWPIIEELPYKTTFDWLKKHWRAIEHISENKIQRALNAFSFLFHQNNSFYTDISTELFHALVGIEAIYVSGKSNVQTQVNQKSQLLLGERKEFKKIFNNLYNHRSRYIHGDLNLVNKFFADDMKLEYDQRNETYENSAFATAILIASIQKHIILDANEFEFELILKNNHNA